MQRGFGRRERGKNNRSQGGICSYYRVPYTRSIRDSMRIDAGEQHSEAFSTHIYWNDQIILDDLTWLYALLSTLFIFVRRVTEDVACSRLCEWFISLWCLWCSGSGTLYSFFFFSCNDMLRL
ncbi:hypothetical protein M440DRAFT_1124448 [Trichoderma longibrachiatum ATCC 18648]|uniref:Uncharacterized protein n=1 Tax=Trichoderma longibrachiatum ATCC 18648 TaxID=983965 RepID=A0A2T4CFN8_TRILO|nr:hypothetical protein M440DRAFT_1124448 [Trichoderma longibrachiatum ATCC 18648]